MKKVREITVEIDGIIVWNYIDALGRKMIDMSKKNSDGSTTIVNNNDYRDIIVKLHNYKKENGIEVCI